MIEVYTGWLTDFVGQEPNVWAFDGNRLRYRFSNIRWSYANYHPASKMFGYNNVLMDSLDEADVITIAAHEAGHYWTIPDRKVNLYFLALGLICITIPFNVMILGIIFGLITLFYMDRYMKEAEDLAEAFVRNTIGAGMSLNTSMLMIFDSSREPVISKIVAKEIKDSLEELGIEYENYIET